MKYNELLNFEPITEVVMFSKTGEPTYQRSLISTFVFSDAYKKHLIPLIVKNLDYNKPDDAFGLQVVGNYGTGKSHLMSLVSLIAENTDLLDLVQEDKCKQDLRTIAGKFKVLRFELGNTESLWEVIAFQIEQYIMELGINFSFNDHGPISYFDKIRLMMAEFENKYTDKGFLIVIDEMLAYLKGRSAPDKLNSDLAVLQALGQACNSSKFKFIFGVQEMIYHSPEFQFAAEMLQKVNDRYKDIIITKDDVAYIVKNRLLKKNEHQKQKIKDHLDPFLKFFTDMHARTQDYIELFPVHPTYFENFEKIRIGKSQREILKTLSNQFVNILDQEVPIDNPGLMTYDNYWEDIQNNQDLMAIPDVRKVKEVSETVYDKIDSYFTSARAGKKQIARRITNACAIKLLQHELNKQNGTNTEHLVDDLCLTDKLAFDRDFLIDIMESTGNQIITATSGQYFDIDKDNGEFHLRIEGGINFDQKIKVYATSMSPAQKDEYFFKFLEINLPLDHNTYRIGFKIWEHSIEWKSHKTYRDGYIFFGNPNEKSTTHPRQHFYMYFMPIFDDSKKQRNHESDEVYFIMDDLSTEFKTAVTLYGASLALETRADSSQKAIYAQKIRELNNKARGFFDQEYAHITKVDYLGKVMPLGGYTLPGAGATKEQIFSEVATVVLESWFGDENPHYPKFTQLNAPVSKGNYNRLIDQALTKIAKPEMANRDGEGVLSGLGLWVPGNLDYSHSPYAKNILKSLKEKGDGKVLNRDEIIECLHPETNLWVSLDFKIESALEFLVLATLSALGEIEITIDSQRTINSTNLSDLKNLNQEDYFAFTHIRPPKGLNEAALKIMFVGMIGRDLSKKLKDPSTFTKIVGAAEDFARRTVTMLNAIRDGVFFKNIEIISEITASEYRRKLIAFQGFCDKLANYTSEAKMKNFPYSVEEVIKVMEAKPLIDEIELQLEDIKAFETDISYLQQCKQYLTDEDIKNKIIASLSQLADILVSGDSKRIDGYKKELKNLKDQYATWYLKLYLEHRISESDNTKKAALLDSDNKAICDILKDTDFLSSGQYQQLLADIGKLKPSDSNVNKEAILSVPYQEFNPLEYVGCDRLNLKDLKSELENLLELWIITLKDTLDDPIVKKKTSLLDKKTIQQLNDFKTGLLQIDKNNALAIRSAIMELHQGLEKFELSMDGLKTAFRKPLTPDEAITTFKEYIDEISKGKERYKIRIILK